MSAPRKVTCTIRPKTSKPIVTHRRAAAERLTTIQEGMSLRELAIALAELVSEMDRQSGRYLTHTPHETSRADLPIVVCVLHRTPTGRAKPPVYLPISHPSSAMTTAGDDRVMCLMADAGRAR